MVFNSITFVLFFSCVLACWLLPVPWTLKKLFLVGASHCFYAAWNPKFLLLLWLSTVLDWGLAQLISRQTEVRKRRAILVASLVLNLGILGCFKYGAFVTENLATGLETVGIEWTIRWPDVVLPLGISFYTFEGISYVVDVYHRRVEPSRNLLDYALFISFFPHLVAGPIVRARDFLPQCQVERRATGAQFGWGMTLLVFGLFQKVVLADRVFAPVADVVFGASSQVGTLQAWAGTIAFAGQIYCDFAGYSLCAIGTAACLGLVLNENFHFPFAAVGFSDFWRRWHTSLSSWLRDYLYIPLGGQPVGIGTDAYKSVFDDAHWWSLAWCRLAVRGVGGAAWFVPLRGTLGAQVVGRTAGDSVWAGASPFGAAHSRGDMRNLGFLPFG